MNFTKNEIIFQRLFIESKLYEDICMEFSIEHNEVSQYYNNFFNTRPEEIAAIRRIRQLYNNKNTDNERSNFKLGDFNTFYRWYINQYQIQNGNCYYCKTSESVIAELFAKKKFESKRSINRGNHLEIDRKNPRNFEYSIENCVLACYFCNNDKSDVFNEVDYKEYLQNRNTFILNKFNELMTT